MKRQFKLFGIAFIITVLSALVFGAISVNAATVYRRGDVNLDGNININDVTLIQKYLSDNAYLSDQQLYLADFNDDSNVNNEDINLIQNYLAGYIKFYKVKFICDRPVTNPDAMPDAEGKFVNGKFTDVKIPFGEVYRAQGEKCKSFGSCGWYMQRQSDGKWLYESAATREAPKWYSENEKKPIFYYKKLFKTKSIPNEDYTVWTKIADSITDYVEKDNETIILHEQFTSVQFNLQYNSNNGSDIIEKDKYIYYFWNPISWPECSYKNTGYKFDTWFLKRGNKYYDYIDESYFEWTTDKSRALKLDPNVHFSDYYVYLRVFEPDSKFEETITLEAQWKPIEFTCSFTGNGATSCYIGKGIKEYNVPRKYNQIDPLSENKFTRTDYSFTGWYAYSKENKGWLYADKNGNTGWYAKDKQPSGYTLRLVKDKEKSAFIYRPTTIENDTITFYAQWKKIKFKYQFNGNGGKTKEGQKVYYQDRESGATTALNANKFAKSGYTFYGWYMYRKSDKTWRYQDNKGNHGWYKKGQQPNGYYLQIIKNKQKSAVIYRPTAVYGDTIILYAQWKDNKYKNRYALSILGPETSKNDSTYMATMLKNLSFYGNNFTKIQKISQKSLSDIEKSIKSTFAKATKNDVCYIHISCHGSSTGTLQLGTGKNGKGNIESKNLKKIIDKYCKGHVVLMINSCYSQKAAIAGGFSKDSRYTIICSSKKDQESYYHSDGTVGYATESWLEGGGYSYSTNKYINMLADTNHDEKVTLKELCNYTNSRYKAWFPKLWKKEKIKCVIYGSDSFVLFAKN